MYPITIVNRQENTMKKLMTSIILAATMTSCASSPAYAGIIDSIVTSGWSEKKVKSKYTLAVYGFDARVYEWIPEGNPNVRCVFVASNRSSGVSCYNVEHSKESKND
jgi:hypothetical protein